MQGQVRQFDMDESFDAMAERTRIACFDIALEQAPACPVVVFDRAWPPTARDLYLGTALLVPLIEPLDEVGGTADFKVYHVGPFGICRVDVIDVHGFVSRRAGNDITSYLKCINIPGNISKRRRLFHFHSQCQLGIHLQVYGYIICEMKSDDRLPP